MSTQVKLYSGPSSKNIEKSLMENKSGVIGNNPVQSVYEQHMNQENYLENVLQKNHGNLCFAEITKMWLLAEKAKTKESTYARYSMIISNHINPLIGEYSLKNVGRQQIDALIQYLLSDGRTDQKGGLSEKTVSDILVVIKSVLSYAEQIGISTAPPVSSISIRTKCKSVDVLDEEEEIKLLTFLYQDMDLYKLGIMISLFTGIRIGELCALKWENVVIEKRIIKIEQTIQRIMDVNSHDHRTKIIITEPKSASSLRVVPIPPILHDTLKKFSASPQAYILTGKINYAEPRIMQYHFHNYLKDAGIRRTNFHTLRHTFATRCIESGMDIKCVSEILGHSTVNMTLNRYVHTSLNLKISEIEKLSRRYENTVVNQDIFSFA